MIAAGASPKLQLVLQVLCVLLIAGLAEAGQSGVHGRITDPSGLPMPGVVVTLSAEGSPPVTGVTDENGDFTLGAPDGRYRFTAEIAGFQKLDIADVVVHAGDTTLDEKLSLAELHDSVTVTAEPPRVSVLGEPEPNAPATLARPVIDNALVWNNRYEDLLTLMPNVVHGPNNRITIAGAPALTGALVVDGFDQTDPVSGAAGIVVPLNAIDTIDVHAGGYPADFGRATGGVTSIQTIAGTNQFHLSADSLLPRLLFEDGGVHGVEYWEPNAGASGQIVKNRVFFETAFSYRYDRNRFDTLAGTERNVYNQPLSWSQIDANLSSRQHLRVALAFDQQHTDRAGITAFTPGPTVPALAEDGLNVSASDRVTVGKTAGLEFRASWLETHSSVTPHGGLPYALGHELASGSYFDEQSRRGSRLETGAIWTFMPSTRQVVKAGASVGYASLDETDHPKDVSFLRSNGSVSRTVSFADAVRSGRSSEVRSGRSSDRPATREGALFAQDTWTPRPWLVVDGGVRYDRMAIVGDGTIAPRLAWTIKTNQDKTTVSGSAGWYGDKLPLSALAFPMLPARIEQPFDLSGAPGATPPATLNVIDGPILLPWAFRWDLGVDRTLPRGLLAHLRYQQRDGHDELVVNTSSLDSLVVPAGQPALALSSRGGSRARSLEATLGIRARGDDEFYVSYVRAKTSGDLNTFDAVDGLFKAPLVRPNEEGPLPADVPNHFLAWGLLHTPARLIVAPFLDIHSGFPYTPIDDDWEYVAPRNSARLPTSGTLDLSIMRVVDLPRQLPRARMGLKFYNLASFNTEREIQRDVQSPNYLTRYDPIFRDFSFVCVLLVGQHQ